jgi:hypothetical protein
MRSNTHGRELIRPAAFSNDDHRAANIFSETFTFVEGKN